MNTIYNEYFFTNYTNCGGNYFSEEIQRYFEKVADGIIKQYAPRTVIDAGCAAGFLVQALRERGVEAYGFDLSEYVINMVDPSISEYCFAHSIMDELPAKYNMKYDLVTCFEVLEHLYPEDAEKAIANLCKMSDTIEFSSTPYDREENTHVNVQLQEYWVRMFAANGFFREHFNDHSYIYPWAMGFSKRDDYKNIAMEYEMVIRHMADYCDLPISIYRAIEDSFSENNKVNLVCRIDNATGDFCVYYDLNESCRLLRIDFGEYRYCVIKDLCIAGSDGNLKEITGNYIKIDGLYVFNTTDPQVIINIDKPNDRLSVKGSLFRVDKPFINELIDEFLELNIGHQNLKAENQNIQTENDSLRIENQKLQEDKQELSAENQKLQEDKQELSAENQKLQEDKQNLEAENQNIQTEIQNLRLEKLSLKETNQSILTENNNLQSELQSIHTDNQNLQIKLDNTLNSLSWRLTKPLRSISDIFSKNKAV